LTGRIRRRLNVAEAVLDTLEADPQARNEESLSQAWNDLQRAVDGLDSHLRWYQNREAWRGYVRLKEIRAAIRDRNADEPELAAVAAKIRNRNQLDGKDQQEFLSGEPFVRLEQALSGLLSLTGDPPKVDMSALRAELKKRVAALEEYEATNKSTAAAAARTAYNRIYELSADRGQAVGRMMRTNYFNYNFRVYVSEAFLNRLFSECTTRCGRIRDRVLGADVSGSQRTTAGSAVDLRPSRRNARFDITLNGVTRSNTVGVTDQAKVWTTGHARFWARKGVTFDGNYFYPHRHVSISVRANNRTTKATTKYSWIPILGDIADSYALSEARKRKSQSEAITRRKLRQRVVPEFNSEVSREFGKVNSQLRNTVHPAIEKAGVKPDAVSVRSTNTLMLYSSRVMNTSELAGSSSNPDDTPGSGITLKVHESAMNNAFDRLNIAGRTMTKEELIDEIEDSLRDLLGKEPVPPAPGKVPEPEDQDKFVFDSNDPIRFRVSGGNLNIIIRAGLKPEGKEEIPTQVVTVPLKIAVKDNKIHVERGTVLVAPAKPVKNAAEQIARAQIMRKKIQDSLPSKSYKQTISFKGDRPMTLTITRIRTVDGWVTVWAN